MKEENEETSSSLNFAQKGIILLLKSYAWKNTFKREKKSLLQLKKKLFFPPNTFMNYHFIKKNAYCFIMCTLFIKIIRNRADMIYFTTCNQFIKLLVPHERNSKIYTLSLV